MLSSHERKYSFLDILIVLFLIIYMDIPFFDLDKTGRLIFLISLVVIFLFKVKRYQFDIEIVFVVLITASLIIIQGLMWHFNLFTLFSFIGLIVLTPYLALRIVGIKFLIVFSDILYIIAIYTTILWLAQNLIPSFDTAIQNLSVYVFPFGTDTMPRSMIFYTAAGFKDWAYLPELGLYRNSGVFHEPGAYAVFLCLAIAVNMIKNGLLFSKKNIFLILVIITTFSTAGFFSLFIIILLYYLDIKRKVQPFISFILLLLMSIIFYFITTNVFFLGEKVVNTYQEETSRDLNSETSGRIFSLRKAILVLTENPITGKGIISSVREDMSLKEDTAGYGFMSFFSSIGIILSVLFIIYFAKGTKRISVFFSGSQIFWHILLFSMAINLFSQKFIIDSVFMMILFIGILKRYSFKTNIRQNTNLTLQKDEIRF
jgi:hypothetical protein